MKKELWPAVAQGSGFSRTPLPCIHRSQEDVLSEARSLLVEEEVGVDEVVSALQRQQEEQRSLNERLASLAEESELQRSRSRQ